MKRNLLPVAVIAALAVAAAGAGYVVAQTLLGTGNLTVRIVASAYPVSVEFYSDNNCTQRLSSIEIPQGQGNYGIVYVKLANTSNNDYMNLYVTGGGPKLWMNVYKLDGSGVYVDGNVTGSFNLAKGSSIVLKVLVGPLSTASAGDELTLGLSVMKD